MFSFLVWEVVASSYINSKCSQKFLFYCFFINEDELFGVEFTCSKKENFAFVIIYYRLFVAGNWKNKQNSFFAAAIKKGTFEIHLCNVCACIHSMGRAALFYYTCTKLMNNFNKVMKMKRKQCANLKKQSRNEQEQVWKKKTITITKMQTKNETLTQK